jgi:hypothetical protein
MTQIRVAYNSNNSTMADGYTKGKKTEELTSARRKKKLLGSQSAMLKSDLSV